MRYDFAYLHILEVYRVDALNHLAREIACPARVFFRIEDHDREPGVVLPGPVAGVNPGA